MGSLQVYRQCGYSFNLAGLPTQRYCPPPPRCLCSFAGDFPTLHPPLFRISNSGFVPSLLLFVLMCICVCVGVFSKDGKTEPPAFDNLRYHGDISVSHRSQICLQPDCLQPDCLQPGAMKSCSLQEIVSLKGGHSAIRA